ncbi:MAG: heme lyase CcmF/NrfE family subunit [Pseudomonadota bacterium]
MIEIGHLAAFLAFGFSIAQGWTGLSGDREAAGRLALSAFAAMAIAFAALVLAFARSDFSVELVAEHSSTLKPFIYKLAGTWGNHEGSMAMWCLVTLGFGAAGAAWLRTDRQVFEARAIGVQGLLGVGALAYLLFASSPFLRLDAPPLQGSGLNPLLQDPALAAHPPMLYLGYVGYSFVFALAAAGLMEARIDRDWAKIVRPWAMAAWVPLTLGIALGSYWAYYELGWGGWWFWDPVENASFMPWLVGSALLHSIIVTEKRGGFAAWTALLAVLTFCFSILGAFLVRSGVLTSVHAFAVDPLRGGLLLTGLIVYGGAALALFAWRAPALKGGPAWALVSREGALMLNNLVIAAATATVLLGTLFPLIAEAAGRQMSVGEPYFNLTFAPMMAALLAFLPVVQGWSWGKADAGALLRWIGGFAVLFLAMRLLAGVLREFPAGAALGVALGYWLIFGALVEVGRRGLWEWRAVGPSLRRCLRLPRRVWGMTLAHAGVGVFILGAVVETTARETRTVGLAAGGSAVVAGWTLTLEGVRAIEGPNWYADEARLIAAKGDRQVVLEPQKRFYPAARMPTTETAIHRTGTGDLYAAFGDRREVDGEPVWTFSVYYNPWIDMVFGGVVLIALGGVFSWVPRRRRVDAPVREAATT